MTISKTKLCLAASLLLCVTASMAAATTDPNNLCTFKRQKAWTKYRACIDAPLAKAYKLGAYNDIYVPTNVAWAKCRHRYFKAWQKFQTSASLAGTACAGDRFTDNDDGSVTDNLTRLTWEKKDDAGGTHDKDNLYMWSTGAPWDETGTAFTDFLATLNSAAFAGSNGWRLPSIAELQTIVQDYACSGPWGEAGCVCASDPCVDPELGTIDDLDLYMSSSTDADFSGSDHEITFYNGSWGIHLFCPDPKACTSKAIGVRGGF